MTRSKQPSIDGFIPRRITEEVDRSPEVHNGLTRTVGEHGLKPQGEDNKEAPVLQTSSPHGLSRQELDATLGEIDKESDEQKKHRKHHTSRRKIIKRIILGILLIGILVGGYLGVKIVLASAHVFNGNIFGLIQSQPLKQDAQGQTNILILGTSEDDPGHEASYLTDSIMIMSVNQQKKTATMFSIPRDLEVEYGTACLTGYAGKINAYFNCVNAEDSEAAEKERQAKARDFFGKIVGLDIQYSIHVNYTVMRDVVKAVGDITVNIEGSEGAPGVMDSNFDWKCRGGNRYASRATMIKNCPPNGHFIDYPNGPAVLDAEHALYLAQARGDIEPTYGLANSNFDREKNQQKIILAIREKALSTGTLTDITKVSALIDALDSNLRTNIETSEIRTALSLANDIPATSIQRLDLLGDKLMSANGQPAAGLYNYTQLQSYIKKALSTDPVVKEGAVIAVFNASGQVGLAGKVSTKLENDGFTVTEPGNAPATSNVTYEIYDVTKKKTATKQKLEQRFSVTTTTAPLQFDVTGVDFVIIVGSSAQVSE